MCVVKRTGDERVAESELAALVAHCADTGLDAVFVAGSNGESSSLTARERDRAFAIALKAADGKIPVLCGVLESGTQRVIEGLKSAEKAGAEYAVVTTPFYTGPMSDETLVRHFSALAESTALRLILYNVPKFTQNNITQKVIERLLNIGNIVGIKESSADFSLILRHISFCKTESFRVYQGITEYAAPSILFGADGYIPVLAPLMPELFLALMQSAHSCDAVKAREYQALVTRLGQILKVSDSPAACAKYAISLLGMSSGYVSKPARLLRDEEKERIRQIYSEVSAAFQGI